MTILKKNPQGFVIIGTDFDTNYGKNIHACFQFELKGFEISVSTGVCHSKHNMYPTSPTSILLTNIETGVEVNINGSVEDAITYVLLQSQVPSVDCNVNDESVNMKKFGGNDAAADSLYNNQKYDNEFKVETTSGDIINVTLGWEQGRVNNYRFYIDGSTDYYLPREIAKVEVL